MELTQSDMRCSYDMISYECSHYISNRRFAIGSREEKGAAASSRDEY